MMLIRRDRQPGQAGVVGPRRSARRTAGREAFDTPGMDGIVYWTLQEVLEGDRPGRPAEACIQTIVPKKRRSVSLER